MTTSQKPIPPYASRKRPLTGHVLEFMRDRQGLLHRGVQEHGHVFSVKLANKNAAVLIGPDHHQTFFGETDKSLRLDKSYQFLKAMFGEIGFAAPPEVYKEQRPILLEPFKGNKMPRYLEVMQSETQLWIDSLPDQGELELTGAFNHLVQNIAGHALMGKDFHDNVGREFWDLYEDLSASIDVLLPPNLPLPKFRRRDRAKKKMRAILDPILQERRAHPERYDDFLQTFVNQRYKDGREVEDDVIIGLIVGLMFAGHETTAGQGAWTLIQLLQHPQYRHLVESDIAQNLPVGNPIVGPSLASLPHLAWALRETERLRPSADLLMRYAEKEVELEHHRIPANWLVIVVAEIAHLLPDYFAQSEVYDPLRFAPGREEDKQHRFALIGFGGGTHKCAGMNFANNEMMVITALMLQQLDLELITKNPAIRRGMGANRPAETHIRFRRRSPGEINALQQQASTAVTPVTACPHVAPDVAACPISH
jgi:sterol 14-demethylase